MITGITPKRTKRETLSDALTPLANAITKAFTGNQACSSPEKSAVASQQCVITPAKVADVRMKNLEQLEFLVQLYEEGIRSHAEFMEQKGIILDSLRKLNRCLHAVKTITCTGYSIYIYVILYFIFKHVCEKENKVTSYIFQHD